MLKKLIVMLFFVVNILSIAYAQTDDPNLPAVVGIQGELNVYYVHDGSVDLVYEGSSIAGSSGPWWSNDGHSFAISTWVNHDSQQIKQFDIVTQEWQDQIAVGWETPIPSPDFTQVVYENVWSNGYILNMADMSGSEITTIDAMPDKIDVQRFVAWSPDGEWLLFVANRQLYRIRTDGTDRTAIMASNLDLQMDYPYELSASWSANSEWIAFSAKLKSEDEDSQPDIYVVRADGTDLTQLTDHVAADLQPVWSPDGSQIAFVSARTANEEKPFNRDLFLVSVDGSDLQQVTTDVYAHQVYWSENWLVYLDVPISFAGCVEQCYGDIVVIKPDGTEKTKLTEDIPIWSFAVAPD